jgi:hypothetical protein
MPQNISDNTDDEVSHMQFLNAYLKSKGEDEVNRQAAGRRARKPNLPLCSVIRPSLTRFGGAVATINSFTPDHLFEGQSPEFFETVMALAMAANAAERELKG